MTTIHDESCEAERVSGDRRFGDCNCQDRQTDATISTWVRVCKKQDRADYLRRPKRVAA